MIARLRGGSPLLTNVALGVLGAILLGLSRHLAVEFDHFVWGYSETSMFAMAAALGAAWIVYAQPVNRATIWIIAVFAVLVPADAADAGAVSFERHLPVRVGRDGAAPRCESVPVLSGQ